MDIIWGRFVEKTGGKKSRATVPLSWNMWLGVQDISVLAYKKAKLQ